MWAGHDFRDDLEFWATECADAALDLPEPEREPFVAAVCAGSANLLTRTHALLEHAWRESAPNHGGSCRPGDIIRDCVVLRLVGRGGASEVYRAIQRPLKRIVALKVILGSGENLSREAANIARITHPNVVTVYDADLEGPRPCIVMEFIDGVTLRTWMARRKEQGQLPAPGELRTLVRQTVAALSAAHQTGLVHCDVKPENIMLVKVGDEYVARLTDFGIARRLDSAAGPVIGTPGYIAPELLKGGRPDARTDLFAVGVVAYELLTGRPPFAGRSVAETHHNTLSHAPTLPEGVDGTVAALVERALQKDPAHRYQTAQALLADLEVDAELPHEIQENPLLSELPAFARRWWSRHSSGAALAMVWLMWGCVSLASSVGLGASCVRVFWAPDRWVQPARQMLFGYVVEPNAALWYILGASGAALIGCGFLEAAHRGLFRTPTLTTTHTAGPDAPSRLALANRRAFRFVTPAIVVLSLFFVTVPELARRDAHAFGWVQTDRAGSFIHARYEDLKKEGKVGEVPALATECEGCDLRVAAVFNHTGGFAAPGQPWFALFLAVALAQQVAFTAFSAWIVAKVLFFFWMLSTALTSGASHGLRLVPDVGDTDDFRFGLGRMDNVYYSILWAVALGGVGLSLQAAANVTKGTYLLGGNASPALFGQVVTLAGVLVMFAVALLTPVGVFLFLNVRAVDAEMARLSGARRTIEAQLRQATRQEDRERLRTELQDTLDRRAIAKRQTLLPFRRLSFLALLLVCLALLLALPLSVQALSRGRDGVGHAISDTVCTVSGNAAHWPR